MPVHVSNRSVEPHRLPPSGHRWGVALIAAWSVAGLTTAATLTRLLLGEYTDGARLFDDLVQCLPLVAAAHVAALAFSHRQNSALSAAERANEEQRQAVQEQRDRDAQRTAIIEQIQECRETQSAFAALFRILIPSARTGWAAFFALRNGRAEIRFERGISRAARTGLTLDPAITAALRDRDSVRFTADELRTTQFAAQLATEDRRKIRDVHLFRVGRAEQIDGIVATTQLFPVSADEPLPDYEDWCRSLFRELQRHLSELLRSEQGRDLRHSRQLVQHLHQQAHASTDHEPAERFSPETFVRRLRELLGVDRISVYDRAAGPGTPGVELLFDDGVTVPIGIERAWKEHERRLAADAECLDIDVLTAERLRDSGVETIVGTAVLAAISTDGEAGTFLVLTHRGRWELSAKAERLIAGCCECLREGLTHDGDSAQDDASAVRQPAINSDGVSLKSPTARDDFLAVMSHELRTPVSGILGMTELALNTQLTGEQREYLSLVQSSSQSLLTMLNDRLDRSKNNRGNAQSRRMEFDLRPTLAEALKTIGCKAHQKRLELCLRIAPSVPQRLFGDPMSLRQVIVNLVGNAVKFTQRGEVEVSVDVESSSDAACRLRFAVRDTGPGIDPAAQQRIFRKYEQATAADANRADSTGLGLAICQQLVGQMGGEIGVRSEPPHGSTFHFTAEYEYTNDADRSAEPPYSSDPLPQSVLIVDDNATSREVLREMLQSISVDCRVAESADEAVAMIRDPSFPSAARSAMLLDAHLPAGRALLEQIRHIPDDVRPAAVLMKSIGFPGESIPDDEGGITQSLFKPVHRGEVVAALTHCRMFQRDDSCSAEPDPETGTGDTNLHILLAEDNAVNQCVAVNNLEAAGFRVTTVENGREAIEAVLADRFDLVFMDVMMPERDGISATREIRRREAGTERRTPIVAMTARTMPEDRLRCINAGMDGYITKPFSLTEVAECIDGLMAEGTLRPAEKDNWVRMRNSLRRDEPTPPSDEEGNVQDEVATLFHEMCRDQLVVLKRAVCDGETSTVEEAAHSLKGAAGCLGADDLEEVLFKLERMGAEGRLASAAETVDLVEAAIDRLLDA